MVSEERERHWTRQDAKGDGAGTLTGRAADQGDYAAHLDCPGSWPQGSRRRYRGVEFRVSSWAKVGHRMYPVWNVTKRTKDIMSNKPNCEYAKFKEIIK